MSVIIKPVWEIIEICDIVDASISTFLKVPDRIPSGKFEHEVTANIQIYHSIRMLESIVELARKDLVLVQSALVLSRSIFEGLVKTCWILLPNDKFENECRFISYLQSESGYWHRLGGIVNLGGTNAFIGVKQQVDEFIDGVSKLLDEKGYKIPKLPNFKEMLKEFHKESLYADYVILSQYSHLSHYSTSIYQRNLGTQKTFEESANIHLWKMAFRVSLPLFHFATEFFVASLGNALSIYDQHEIERFSQLIQGN